MKGFVFGLIVAVSGLSLPAIGFGQTNQTSAASNDWARLSVAVSNLNMIDWNQMLVGGSNINGSIAASNIIAGAKQLQASLQQHTAEAETAAAKAAEIGAQVYGASDQQGAIYQFVNARPIIAQLHKELDLSFEADGALPATTPLPASSRYKFDFIAGDEAEGTLSIFYVNKEGQTVCFNFDAASEANMLSITISRDNSEGTHLYPTTVKIVPPVQIRDIVLDSGVAPNVHGKISWPPSGMLKWSFVSEKIKEWENHSGVSDALEQADMGHL